ncbi:extracellular solute-binding protein [Paenibacillus apiarius]|uniref:extracellular solute-binding protein n=1 Tax=Paenibacillus apiarius TaxID=46240 RepID=UPI00197CFFAA|nr:extracellular solute-binding protein [Paenibacillus apiarius]MBN3522410.1 extracellular solute-binding protein [Paenibacillus apiarius]
MRKRWISVLVFLLVASIFTACAGGTGTTASGKDGSAGGSDANAPANPGGGKDSGESVKLSLWHNFTGDDLRAQAMRDIIEQFKQSHPHVALDIQAIPPDGYKTRLKTVAAANEMPDVFLMWPGTMTKEFHGGGLIQPINELLDGKPDWKSSFLPGSFDDFTIDGGTYSVPMGLSPTSILYYNQAIFDKYGLQVPATWDDLMKAVATLKENKVTPIALGNKAAWLAQSSIMSSIADRVTGTEWFLKAANQDGAQFTDPGFVKALELFQGLQEAGAFQDGENSIDNTQMEMMFAQGQAAMMIDGGWALTNLSANATPEALQQMGAAVLPAVPGGKGDPKTLSGVVGVGLGLSKKAEGKRKEAAYDLIFAMSGPEAQKRTLEANQLVSFKLELDESKVSPLFAKVNRLVNEVKRTPVYDAVLTSAGTDAVNNGLQELLMGGKPEAVAQKIQEAQAKALGK